MIHFRKEHFTFSGERPFAELSGNSHRTALQKLPDRRGFTVIADVDFSRFPKDGRVTLVGCSGAFTLERRFAKPRTAPSDFLFYKFDSQADERVDVAQHYASFPMPDGTCPVIEGRVNLRSDDHPEWHEIRVGFAQSRLAQGPHRIVFHTDGVRLHIYADGLLMDENFIYGEPAWAADGGEFVTDGLCAAAELHVPPLKPAVSVSRETSPCGIQFFKPASDGAWVGDVVPFSHDGTVHLFYLLDRRHHGSKFGTGAHYYGHLSSRDLVEWTEHEPIGELEAQWESCGTGTPFFHNGKFYFAYGLHTDRFIPYEKNGGAVLRAEAAETGTTHARTFAELGERRPEGMTFAVSDDCIHFEKSRKLTHFSENPSVYTMPDGTLRMYADGIWKADKVDGEWRCVDRSFPPEGKESAMRNTLECPSFFEWGGYYYCIVGMDGFYASPTPDFAHYTDLAAEGLDVYDGEVVPMVIPFGEDRRLISGWIFPFGSYMVVHELVKLPEHALGIKWCPELYPPVKEKTTLCEGVSGVTSVVVDAVPASYACYEMTVRPGEKGQGKVALRFASASPLAPDCELQIDLAAGAAQFESVSPETGDSFCAPLKTMREVMDEWRGRVTSFKEMPMAVKFKCHVFSRDFRIDRLRGIDGDFKLRVMLKFDPVMPSTIIDVEIAGVRTMVSMRADLKVTEVSAMTSGGASIGTIRRSVFENNE